jgi:hypothetical protein
VHPLSAPSRLPLHPLRKFKRYNAARKLRSAVRSIIVINRLRKQFSVEPSNAKAGSRDARITQMR